MTNYRFNIEEQPDSVKLTVSVDAKVEGNRTKPYYYKQHISCNSVEEANAIVKDIKSFDKGI